MDLPEGIKEAFRGELERLAELNERARARERREVYVRAALEGFAAATGDRSPSASPRDLARRAIQLADATIAELDAEEGPEPSFVEGNESIPRDGGGDGDPARRRSSDEEVLGISKPGAA